MPAHCSLIGLAALIAGLLVSVDPSHAFELGNFKSGMSSAEARAAAHERGWIMVAAPPPLEPKVPASRTSFDMTHGKTSLEFCNDRLAGVRTVVPEGFKGIVSVMADLIERYGEPRTRAYSLGSAPSEDSNLSFTWELKDGERREILYTDQGSAEPWALYFLTGLPSLCDRAP